GMVGVLEDASMSVGHALRAAGDAIFLAGGGEPRLDGAAWLDEPRGRPEPPDLAAEAALCEFLARSADAGLLPAAHDVAAGGLARALAESAIAGGVGAEVDLPPAPRADVAMFGESAGRVLVSARDEDEAALRALAGDVPFRRIGTAGGERLVLRACGRTAELALDEASEAWERAIPEALAA